MLDGVLLASLESESPRLKWAHDDGMRLLPRPGSSCAEAAMIAGLQGSPLVGIAGIDVAVPANLSGGRQFVDLGQGVGKVSV